MGQRLQLHEDLCRLMGNRNVYFQPPNGIRMQYPCIVYERSRIDTTFADDKPYSHQKEYSVTIIYTDPDSQIPDMIAKSFLCKHERAFKNDNLNHDTFKLYY